MARKTLLEYERDQKLKEKKATERVIRERKEAKRKAKETEVATKIVKAQLLPTKEEQTIPMKKRGTHVRDKEGKLVKTKDAAPFIPMGARSIQPAAPVDMPPSIDEAVWIKFMALVAFHAGNVRRACIEMKIPRQQVWDMEQKDPAFKLRLQQAKDQGIDALEEEGIRRAYEGVEEPVGFYQGNSNETKTVYSDTLLMFMLKANRPEKYAERTRNENLNLNVESTREELAAARKTIFDKLAGIVKKEEEPIDVTPPPPEIPSKIEMDEPGGSEEETETVETVASVTNWDVED